MHGVSRYGHWILGRSVAFWAASVGAGVALLVLAATGRPVAAHGKPPGRVAAAGAPAASLTPAASPHSYRQVDGISLGPGIGASPADIAADPHGPWAYVANSGSGDISVLSGTVAVDTIFVGGAPSLVRVDPATGWAYVAGAADGRVLLLDHTTIVGSVDVGGNPAEVLFQPVTGWAYLAMPDQDEVVVLSGTAILARVPLEGGPAMLQADPNRPWVYVGRTHLASLAVISGTAVVAEVDLGAPATAVSFAADTGWTYVAAGEQVVVLSGTAAIAMVPVWATAVDLAWNPGNGHVYVSREEQYMGVISGTELLAVVDDYIGGGHVRIGEKGLVYVSDRLQWSEWLLVVQDTEAIGTFHTPCDVMEASAATGLVYTTSPWFLGNGDVTAFDRISATVIGPAPEIVQVAVHPQTAQVYLAALQNRQAVYAGEEPADMPQRQPAGPPVPSAPDTAVGQLYLLSGTAQLGPIELSALPWDMAIHPQTGLVYIALGPGGVAVFDGAALAATVPVDGCAAGIAVQPTSGLVYVADHCRSLLHVLSGTELLRSIPLLPNAQGYLLEAHPAGGRLYVAEIGGRTVTVVSGTQPIATIYLCPWEESCISSGMDGAPETGYTYLTDESHDRLWVLSGTAVYTTVTLPAPRAVHVHPTNGLAYVSAGQGLAVFDGVKLRITIPVTGISSMASSTRGAYLFAGGPEPGQALVLAGTRLAQRLETGALRDLGEFAVDPASGRLYASTYASSLLILEEYLPYRFYLHLVLVGPRVEGGQPH